MWRQQAGNETAQYNAVTELVSLLRPLSVVAPPPSPSITRSTLPLFTLAVSGGTLLLSGQMLVDWPLQAHIGLGVFVGCVPLGAYYTVRSVERLTTAYLSLLERRAEIVRDRDERQARLRREAAELQHVQLMERTALFNRRTELRIQEALYSRRVDEAVGQGTIRRERPDLAVLYDQERQWWRSEVLSVLYAPENSEKTRKGNWIGGQPITLKKLGKTRYDLCRVAGLITIKGNHPQWSLDVAPDESRAMEVLEAAGVFRVTDKKGE